MKFMENAFQSEASQCKEPEYKSASIPDWSGEASPNSMEDDNTSIIVMTAADYHTTDGENHHRLLDNPFKLFTTEERERHLRINEFILKVELATTVLSELADRNISQVQSSTLVTDLQELAKMLSRRLAIYKSVKTFPLNAGLDDAVWESQETMMTLLQLLPEEQKSNPTNGPGWEPALQRLLKWLLTDSRLPHLQRKIAYHIRVLKAQLDRVQNASYSSSSSVQGTTLLTEQCEGPCVTAVWDGDSNSVSTYSVPSLTTTITQESSLGQYTLDHASQPDLDVDSGDLEPPSYSTANTDKLPNTSPSDPQEIYSRQAGQQTGESLIRREAIKQYWLSAHHFDDDRGPCHPEGLDHFQEDFLQGIPEFHETTPRLRRIYSTLQVLEDAACGAEAARNSPPSVVGGEIRLCGLCTGYVEDELGPDVGNRVVGPSYWNAVDRWLASRDDPWTALQPISQRQCQLTQRFSRDPGGDARHFYYFDLQTLCTKSGQIASKSLDSLLAFTANPLTQTKHSNLAALREDLYLNPACRGVQAAGKAIGFAGGAGESSGGRTGPHDNSKSSSGASVKKVGQLDASIGKNYDNKSSDDNDSGGNSPTSHPFKPNFAEYFQCIYRDDPSYPRCFLPFEDSNALKRHMNRVHNKSYRKMKISKMNRPSEAEKCRMLHRILRPGQEVPSPYFIVCKCSALQRNIGEANDLVFRQSVWESGQASRLGPESFNGNYFRPMSGPVEFVQPSVHTTEVQHHNERIAANTVLPRVTESSNHGVIGTSFDVEKRSRSAIGNFPYFDIGLPISSSVVAESMNDWYPKSALSGTTNPMAGYNLANLTGEVDSPAFNRKNDPMFSALPCAEMEAPFNGLIATAPMDSLGSGFQFEQSGTYLTNSVNQQDFSASALPFDVDSLTHTAYLDSDTDSLSMPYGHSNPSQTTRAPSFPGWAGSERWFDFSRGYAGISTSFPDEEAPFQSRPHPLQHSSTQKRNLSCS